VNQLLHRLSAVSPLSDVGFSGYSAAFQQPLKQKFSAYSLSLNETALKRDSAPVR
jgi:hypothetical protein